MILQQFYLSCLAHASYLIGDRGAGTAVVVDPQRDVGQYIESGREQGLVIRHVFLTHFHADFVAGHLELRDATGASIHLGARAEAEYGFVPMRDGDRLEIGKVRLTVLETPGHTPEGISILVHDMDADPGRPHAVLTGDTLFIGDVGRPDLMAAVGVTAEELGGMLYASLREKLLALPDETLVYPAHGAGSMCGKNLSTDTVSTIGVQRRYNYALQPMSRDEFIRLVTSGQPETPRYFAHDAMLNRRERTTLEEALERESVPLSLARVLDLAAEGAQILDVRDPADFAGAHLRGSINIGLGGKFATWAGTILDKDRPIVIVGDPGSEEEAATRLGRIGLDGVAGFLDGGMQALRDHPDLVKRIDRVTAAALREQLEGKAPPLVIDVRTPAEHEAAAIPTSRSIPLNHMADRLDEVPRDRAVVVHCASGYRSSIAASLIARAGIGNVIDLVGGMGAWESSGGWRGD